MILLLSCGNKQKEEVVVEQPLPFEFSPRLLEIDSLVQHDADSALMVLVSRGNGGNSGDDSVISTEAERSGEISSCFNENYHSLLLSEALYKTNNPQYYRFVKTCHGASLQDAMRCFDSLHIIYPTSGELAMLTARSHYMNGVGFYENDSVVEACGEYLKTLEIMEEHFEEKEIIGYKARFMALTYNRLADLFSDQFMMEPAIYCGRKALHFCKIEPTSKYGVTKILHRVGIQYDAMNNSDSAAYYYKQALAFLPDTNNLVYRDLVASMAINSYTPGHGAENSLNSLKQIIKQTDDPAEKLTRYLTLGSIYYEEKIYDSATIYLESVFENKSDAISRFQAAEYLYNIYLHLGDTVNSYKYAGFLADNAAQPYDHIAEVSILNSIFRNYLKQKEKRKFYDKNKTILSIPIISVIIVLTIIIIAKLKYDKRIKDSNKKSEIPSDENKTAALLSEPVCKLINTKVKILNVSARDNYYKYNVALSDDVVAELHTAISKHCENFDTILLGRCSELKPNDFLLCYLLLLGLNEKQIAVLRNRTYSAIKKQINKVEKQLKIEEKLSDYIKSLI